MVGRRSGRFLDEDTDLAVALRFGVDPHVVNTVWPVELRERAVAWMAVEAKRAGRRGWRG